MPRPRRTISTALMTKAVRLYYLDDRSKVQIAAELQIDRRHVDELLATARRDGLIRFDIFETAALELEKQFAEKYPHLKKVIIRPGVKMTDAAQYAGLVRQLAIGGSSFFEELPKYFPRKSSLTVAVSGGRIILGLVNSIAAEDRHNIYIQLPALIGRGYNQKSTDIDPIVNASVLWARCGYLPGHCQYATVAPYPPRESGLGARKAVRTELEKAERNEAVAKVIHGMDNIDVAFTVLGTVNADSAPAKFRGLIGTDSLLESIATSQQLEAEGAVGSMGYCFFDETGHGREDWRFWLTAGHFSERNWGIEFYKHMVEAGKIVVAFANPFDPRAVRTALRARMFNVLVADELSVKQILEQD